MNRFDLIIRTFNKCKIIKNDFLKKKLIFSFNLFLQLFSLYFLLFYFTIHIIYILISKFMYLILIYIKEEHFYDTVKHRKKFICKKR